jgi:hypothetical protein
MLRMSVRRSMNFLIQRSSAAIVSTLSILCSSSVSGARVMKARQLQGYSSELLRPTLLWRPKLSLDPLHRIGFERIRTVAFKALE